MQRRNLQKKFLPRFSMGNRIRPSEALGAKAQAWSPEQVEEFVKSLEEKGIFSGTTGTDETHWKNETQQSGIKGALNTLRERTFGHRSSKPPTLPGK